jgi:hypothetical protein
MIPIRLWSVVVSQAAPATRLGLEARQNEPRDVL